MNEINARVRVFTSRKSKYAVLSLPLDSLPTSKKLRILGNVRGTRFDAKAYSFSSWCLCHLPKDVANELRLKNDDRVKLKLVRTLAK